MKVEIGKCYRLVHPDAVRETVVVEDGADGDGWVETDVGMPCGLKDSRRGLYVFNLQHDEIAGGLYLEEVDAAQVDAAVPLLGDDPAALARLRERFKTWDFSTGTY